MRQLRLLAESVDRASSNAGGSPARRTSISLAPAAVKEPAATEYQHNEDDDE
jgi:hypothetical protein